MGFVRSVVVIGRPARAPVLIGVSAVWEVRRIFWPTGLAVGVGLVTFPTAMTVGWVLIETAFQPLVN